MTMVSAYLLSVLPLNPDKGSTDRIPWNKTLRFAQPIR